MGMGLPFLQGVLALHLHAFGQRPYLGSERYVGPWPAAAALASLVASCTFFLFAL